MYCLDIVPHIHLPGNYHYLLPADLCISTAEEYLSHPEKVRVLYFINDGDRVAAPRSPYRAAIVGRKGILLLTNPAFQTHHLAVTEATNILRTILTRYLAAMSAERIH